MENNESVFTLLFPFLFVGIWCLVSYVLASKSGWVRLAKVFASEEETKGSFYHFQSARINQVNYGGSLEMGVDDFGLTLVPFFLFRLFHKRLVIPWEYMSVAPIKRFLFSGYRLSVTEGMNVHIEISKSQFERMARFLTKPNQSPASKNEKS